MTEVDTITPLRARDLTDRIKAAVEATWALIKEAYTTRAWASLGYDTWDEYCAKEFGATRLKLPREERQEVVGSLREAGLSTRAIASVTGVSHTQIRKDMSGGNPSSNDAGQGDVGFPPEVQGADGKIYPASRPDFGVSEFWEPSADEPAPQPERKGAPDSPAPAPEKKPAAPRSPRTDVVATVAALLTKTEDAATLAGRLAPSHMATRKEEAAVWSRRLETALDPLQRLLNTLKENQ